MIKKITVLLVNKYQQVSKGIIVFYLLNLDTCFFHSLSDPEIPKKVQVMKKTRNDITVIWTRPECNELFPFIKHYIVYWCRLDLKDECLQGQSILFMNDNFFVNDFS